ncbi:MFS transporter [Zavarzinella formosa]|uniref:MFS transporter n=1 Tax=Zavarzinella formosa TaxID=360055 RepID=UPI0003142450|nr:MFS transporter [Zavarzinella formosa]
MRYIVLGFLCAATVIAYVQRLALSAPTKMIEAELDITTKQMGIVMAVWYWSYALMQLPSGWLADRLGSRLGLVFFATIWSMLTAATGLATGFTGLLMVWGLMGCAQAGLFPCATKAIGATFPKENQASASGGLSACMAMGSAISHRLSGSLLGICSWRQILTIYTLPGLCWTFLFAVFAPRWKERTTEAEPEEKGPNTPSSHWLKLATDSQMLIICGQQFFRASAVALFYTWLPRYLREIHGLSEERAGELASWPPICGIFGGILGGMLSDRLLKITGNSRLSRQGMAAFLTVICASLGLAAYLVTDTGIVIVLLCGIAFGAMASGVSGYTVAIGYGGNRVATVFATMNMSGNIGAGLFPFVVGWLVGRYGDWNIAMLVFASLFAASAVCWIFLNPKGTLFGDVSPTKPIEEDDDDKG